MRFRADSSLHPAQCGHRLYRDIHTQCTYHIMETHRFEVKRIFARNADRHAYTCTKAKYVKERGRGGRRAGERARQTPQETVAKPQPIWRMLYIYADDAGIVSRWRNNLANDDDRYRCSLWLVRIESFGTRDREHVCEDETCAQGHFCYRGSRSGVQADNEVCVPWGNCVGEQRPYC